MTLQPDDTQQHRGEQLRAVAARAREAARRTDRNPRLRARVERLREALPGDSHFGDRLSLGGSKHTELAGRTLIELTGNRPGVFREVGLTGLQVWQAFLERMGAGHGEHEVTIAFLDLAGFSTWALHAGD